MRTLALPLALDRALRLRRLIDVERRNASRSNLKVLRLQALLLKAQERLASVLSPEHGALVPVTVRPARGPRRTRPLHSA